MKILVIPSWYPHIEAPLWGSFFQEQAQLMLNYADVRIMVSKQNKNSSTFKRIFHSFLSAVFKKTQYKNIDYFFLEPPKAYQFEYPYGIMLNYNMRIQSYLSFFEKEIFPSWKPDIIHAHDTYAGGICAQAISKKWAIPYVITEHNYLLFNYSKRINLKFASALDDANAVLLVSEYQKRILKYRNIGKNFYITGNFVDETFYYPKKEKTDNNFNIIWVGGYAHHKDVPTLIKVIKSYSKYDKTNNFCFHIIGHLGDYKNALENSLPHRILKNNCKIYGNVERKDMPSVFHKMNVLLSTSIAETFGVAICEAMMCGLPVVSTNNGGFDEMYVPGLNGIKCGIGDADALAKSLLDISNGKTMFDAKTIRESVLKKYGRKAFSDKLMNIYTSVINTAK